MFCAGPSTGNERTNRVQNQDHSCFWPMRCFFWTSLQTILGLLLVATPRWRAEKPNLSVDRDRELAEQGRRRLIVKGGGFFLRLPRRVPELGKSAVNHRDLLLIARGNYRIGIEERARSCPLKRGLSDGAERSKAQSNELAKSLKFRSRSA
jgi:hypothetical protein